ncbi:MAG: ABC transporter permease [Planctomycetes bacterium]|nr:ABC transporter permease [Planctomycetota bacterium]
MTKRVLDFAVFVLLLLAAWEALVRAELWNTVLLPAPSTVLAYLSGALLDGTLLDAAAVTARRLGVGYLAGMLAGLPLGLLCSRFQSARDTIGVLALGLQTLPSVCWAPLALLWFGQTEAAMTFVVVMGTTWSILLATADGVRAIPPLWLRAARTMGSRRLHTVLHVLLPGALPAIVSGLKQGWAFAWRSLMAAEIFITILTGFGLGQLLHYGRELHAMDQVLGVMTVIVAIGLLAEQILFGPVERWLRRRFGMTA